MKFILRKNISEFQSKSKQEKKDILKTANCSVGLNYHIYMGVGMLSILALVKHIEEPLLGTDSTWIGLALGLPFAWALGLALGGYILNPKIQEIAKIWEPNKSIMKEYPIRLFWIAEANLIFWLALLGATSIPHLNGAETTLINKELTGLAVAGMLVAAILQHWAYHNIYKPNRDQKK